MSGSTTVFSSGENPLRAAKLNQAISERVLRSGDTMTGLLTLARDPVGAFDAVTKQYVDHYLPGGGAFLPLTGGALTGPLTLSGNAASPLQAVPLQQVLPLAGGTVTGATTFSAAGTALAVTNNATIGGTLTAGGVTAPTQPVATNNTTVATTAFVQAAVAPLANNVGRNLLHNPLFNVQQRGAGPWTTTVYTLDRWKAGVSLDTASFTPVSLADADRTSIGDEAAISGLRCVFTGNAGAASYSFIEQYIERVRRLGGKTVTVSFWATSTGPKLGVNIYQSFGTGGSPSAVAFALATALTVTIPTGGAWTRLSVTIPIPSTAGKTLGTNGDDFTAIRFAYSCGATSSQVLGVPVQSGTIQLWGVQLEIGSVATPLEKLDPRYDLSNCQRFFSVGNVQLNAYNTAGQTCGYAAPFAVQMRAVPAVTPTGTGGANFTAFSFVAASATSWLLTFSAAATGSASWAGTFTASADL